MLSRFAKRYDNNVLKTINLDLGICDVIRNKIEIWSFENDYLITPFILIKYMINQTFKTTLSWSILEY